MFENYTSFYKKLFLSPIKVDELTEKHFPNYSFFESIPANNNIEKKFLFKNHDIYSIKIINNPQNIIIEQPHNLFINALSEEDIDNVLNISKLDDYIFHYSPYAYIGSKVSNPIGIELPQGKENIKVSIRNEFSEYTLNKKIFLTNKNTTYEVEDKFIINKESIFAMDYITAENSTINIVSDLSEINARESSVNYLFILDKNSKLNFSLLGLGTGKIYINIYTIIKGIGAEAKLTGCCLGKKSDETILLTYINHKAPKNTSNVHINNVLFDKARNFFLGLIKVGKNGEEIDAYETNKNLLLSKEARTLSIPKLEIENNNLRCSHSSSISSIEEETLFYLSSRGIPYNDIIKLVATGFLIEPFRNHNYDNVIENAIAEVLNTS